MPDNESSSGFVNAQAFRDAENEQDVTGGVTVFNESGVIYMSGGERSQEYLYMENRPDSMENRC